MRRASRRATNEHIAGHGRSAASGTGEDMRGGDGVVAVVVDVAADPYTFGLSVRAGGHRGCGDSAREYALNSS
jgi:hypothetical protein